MKKLLIILSLMFLVSTASAEEYYTSEAYKQLGQNCQQNDLDSCVKFAIWTRDDLESPSAAFAPLKKACDGGHLKGCNVLGNLYINKYSGLGMNYQKAKALYEYSCQGGYRNACINLESLKYEVEPDDKETRLTDLYHACILENTAACEALEQEMIQK